MKIRYHLGFLLLTMQLHAAPGDVITEDAATDPDLPRAVVDGDLVVEDADGSNGAIPGLYVEGLATLDGGMLLEGMDLRAIYAFGAAGSQRRKIIYNGQDYSTPTSGAADGDLALLVIDRLTGTVISHTGYDTGYPTGSAAARDSMAADLAALPDGQSIVVITSQGSWSMGTYFEYFDGTQFLGGEAVYSELLIDELYRMGASSVIEQHPIYGLDITDKNYVLIGMPGLGRGKGLEHYSELTQAGLERYQENAIGTFLVKADINSGYVPMGLGHSENATAAPTADLEVNGDALVTGDLEVQGALSLNNSIIEITSPENAQSIDLASLATQASVGAQIANATPEKVVYIDVDDDITAILSSEEKNVWYQIGPGTHVLTADVLARDGCRYSGAGKGTTIIEGGALSVPATYVKKGGRPTGITSFTVESLSATGDLWFSGRGRAEIVIRNCEFSGASVGSDHKTYWIYDSAFTGDRAFSNLVFGRSFLAIRAYNSSFESSYSFNLSHTYIHIDAYNCKFAGHNLANTDLLNTRIVNVYNSHFRITNSFRGLRSARFTAHNTTIIGAGNFTNPEEISAPPNTTFYNCVVNGVLTTKTESNSVIQAAAVGIGTDSPQATLHVGGDIQVDGGIRMTAVSGDISMGPFGAE